MDNWYKRFINWFSDIPPGVPATIIREPDHVILIVRPDDAAPLHAHLDVALPIREGLALGPSVISSKNMNARIPAVKKTSKKKRKV